MLKAVYTKGTFHSLKDPRENVENSRQNIHLQTDVPVGGEDRLHSRILAVRKSDGEGTGVRLRSL